MEEASFPGSSVSISLCKKTNQRETKYPENEVDVKQTNFSLKSLENVVNRSLMWLIHHDV